MVYFDLAIDLLESATPRLLFGTEHTMCGVLVKETNVLLQFVVVICVTCTNWQTKAKKEENRSNRTRRKKKTLLWIWQPWLIVDFSLQMTLAKLQRSNWGQRKSYFTPLLSCSFSFSSFSEAFIAGNFLPLTITKVTLLHSSYDAVCCVRKDVKKAIEILERPAINR